MRGDDKLGGQLFSADRTNPHGVAPKQLSPQKCLFTPSKNLSFNLGVRYDQNQSKDQTGLPVVKDSKWSPRLGVTWDPTGAGKLTVNGGYARYVTEVSTALVDAGSAGGRTATYSYFYQGPAINTGAGPYLTAEQALPLVFAWFNANGGLTRATRIAPSIPGVTTKVSEAQKFTFADGVIFDASDPENYATTFPINSLAS